MAKNFLFALFAVTLVVQAADSAAMAFAQGPSPNTELISVDSAGNQVGGVESRPTISGNGRFVAFQASSSGLVPNDTNGSDDIFVHDRDTGSTERVNVSSSEAQAGFISYYPDVSADGRFVSFYSFANNLVANDMNGEGDVFVRDRLLGVTERVDLSSDEVEANNGANVPTSISADGRFVAFQSDSYNLVPGDPFGANGSAGIYLRDRQSGTTELISSLGLTEVTAENPSVSGDGRFVAFDSVASGLVSGDSGFDRDVFVRDRLTGTTEIVSVDDNGVHGNGTSEMPTVSGDGRFVSFTSLASNLVPGDTNGSFGNDIFLRDRLLGTTTRVSVDSSGNQTFGTFGRSDISAAGRFVVFESSAANLVPGDTNSSNDVFMHDRSTHKTIRVSMASDGSQALGNGSFTAWPSISSSGRFVTFVSNGSNLVPNDTNQSDDVFVRDLGDTDADGEWDPFDLTIPCPPGESCPAVGGMFGLLSGDPGRSASRDAEDRNRSGTTSRIVLVVALGSAIAASALVAAVRMRPKNADPN